MIKKSKEKMYKDIMARITGSVLKTIQMKTNRRVLKMTVLDLIKDIENDKDNKYGLARNMMEGNYAVYKNDIVRALKAIFRSEHCKIDDTLEVVLNKMPLSELIATTPYIGEIGAVAIYKFTEFTGIKIKI